MKLMFRGIVVLFAATTLLSGCSCDEPAPVVERLLDEMFQNYSLGKQPGVGVMLIHDGEIALQKFYGQADVERVTPIDGDTAFRLASVSKQFAAMAIMILREDGALSLDDRVSQYVPELAPYGEVTLRHIMLHTGGMPDYYDLIDTSSGMPTNAEAAAVLGEMASPLFVPGERYEYSNSGYDMLGPVVAAASGVSFVEFVHDRIFAVAGMHSSLVHDHTLPKIRNRAFGYAPQGNGFQMNDADALNGIVGSGGIYSSLNDLYRWDQALYGEDLVGRDSLELAFTSGETNDGKQLDYGFGWRIDSYDGHKRLRHGGSWVGFRTHIARIPDLQFTVVLLSNRSDFDPEPYIDPITSSYLANHQ